MDDFTKLGFSLDDYRESLIRDVYEVLRFYVVPNECQHCILERKLCNPYHPPTNPPLALPACIDCCQFCVDGGKVHESFTPFLREGVQQALAQFFFSETQLLEASLDNDELLLVAFCKYPSAQLAFYDSNTVKPISKAVIKRLVLMLLAADILRLRYITKTTPGIDGSDPTVISTLIAWVPCLTSGIPAIYDDTRWALLPTKEARKL